MEPVLDPEGPRPGRKPLTLSPLALREAAAVGVVVPDDLEKRDPYSGSLWKHLLQAIPNELGASLQDLRDGWACIREAAAERRAALEAGGEGDEN